MFVLARGTTYCVSPATGKCGRVKVRKAYLLLLTVVILILFSGSWVLSKEVVGSVSSVLATGVRLLFTTMVLWLWVFCSEGRQGSFYLRRVFAVRCDPVDFWVFCLLHLNFRGAQGPEGE